MTFKVKYLINIYSDQWKHSEIECRTLEAARKVARDIWQNPKVRDVFIFDGFKTIEI